MNTKLFIAKKIKVGFNLRSDTYTGKLGYVIGHDDKKWRKEPSWESWRQKEGQEVNFSSQDENGKWQYNRKTLGSEINPLEFENIPTEGFVLNKKAGGYSSGWNHRSTYCRVYDPRGFEFEISIPNLLYILQECNAYKGKGLEGSFVYAWDGKDLVLLPTSSVEYTESQNFTKLQSGKVGVKDLLEGCTYKNKQLEEFIYLGKFNWFNEYGSENINVKKMYVFYTVKQPSYGDRIIGLTGLANLVQRVTETPVDNYAELLDEFNNSKYSDSLNEIEEVDYHPLTEVSNYYKRDSLTTALLPIGENKYELYEIEANRGDWRRSSSYYNTVYNVSSYNLKVNRVVTIKTSDFEIKSKPTKELENVSLSDLNKMKLKILKTKKNNKDKILTF